MQPNFYGSKRRKKETNQQRNSSSSSSEHGLDLSWAVLGISAIIMNEERRKTRKRNNLFSILDVNTCNTSYMCEIGAGLSMRITSAHFQYQIYMFVRAIQWGIGSFLALAFNSVICLSEKFCLFCAGTHFSLLFLSGSRAHAFEPHIYPW